ncbi:MAG TPA: GPW/gp25 family protein [Candidatus Faecalibacterium faecipullorum]|uniref:GPW/gp25 family protein n=1 Tax=Candidatus Faecalibacterium faecipullorum TaxID=2838578 RepID=A0A9D2MGG2_9FIRM|nr:GPW/gp25 family protein [Candidatus Faecalibacterium faecipullorum]
MNGKEFLGRGLKFPLQVDPRTGKFAMVSHEDDIREAIGIILNTMQGERVMRPGFGSNIMEYTFAPSSSSTREGIARQVREQLIYQEPRITDVNVRCREMNERSGALVVEVDYTVRSTNNRYNHVYPFYLTEGSEGGGGV